MGFRRLSLALASILFFLFLGGELRADGVRIKDLGRFLGWRDNPVVGYGIVTGLSGSGDSPHSEVTRQALKNVLGRLGTNITTDQLESRNVAAVTVTAVLPPSSNVGDRIDVEVSSIGNARSLAGGTLLLTPLMGPDRKVYALAQGALVVGGYRFDANQNVQQRNYPTSAILPGGATVEARIKADIVADDGALTFILKDPDFTTVDRVVEAINRGFGSDIATIASAESVRIQPPSAVSNVYALIARIESITMQPDEVARVVINERSGTVVAGGEVRISSVVISQGDIKVSVSIDNTSGQVPYVIGAGADFQGTIITNTRLDVTEPAEDTIIRMPSTTIADLVQGLSKAHVSTRSMIAILQAMKAAGALHAQLIVQ